jgi:hypothetical protein
MGIQAFTVQAFELGYRPFQIGLIGINRAEMSQGSNHGGLLQMELTGFDPRYLVPG